MTSEWLKDSEFQTSLNALLKETRTMVPANFGALLPKLNGASFLEKPRMDSAGSLTVDKNIAQISSNIFCLICE